MKCILHLNETDLRKTVSLPARPVDNDTIKVHETGGDRSVDVYVEDVILTEESDDIHVVVVPSLAVLGLSWSEFGFLESE